MAHYVAPDAEADLDHIWLYIAKESRSPERADRVVNAITERFYLLSTHPRLGRERPDLRVGLRSFPVEEYVIIYRITETDDVLIMHVPHGRQDIHRMVGP